MPLWEKIAGGLLGALWGGFVVVFTLVGIHLISSFERLIQNPQPALGFTNNINPLANLPTAPSTVSITNPAEQNLPETSQTFNNIQPALTAPSQENPIVPNALPAMGLTNPSTNINVVSHKGNNLTLSSLPSINPDTIDLSTVALNNSEIINPPQTNNAFVTHTPKTEAIFGEIGKSIDSSVFGGVVNNYNLLNGQVGVIFTNLNWVLSQPVLHRKFMNHPQIKHFINNPRFVTLAKDPEINQLLQNKSYYQLLNNQKIADLINDPQIYQTMKNIKIDNILREIIYENN